MNRKTLTIVLVVVVLLAVVAVALSVKHFMKPKAASGQAKEVGQPGAPATAGVGAAPGGEGGKTGGGGQPAPPSTTPQ